MAKIAQTHEGNLAFKKKHVKCYNCDLYCNVCLNFRRNSGFVVLVAAVCAMKSAAVVRRNVLVRSDNGGVFLLAS